MGIKQRDKGFIEEVKVTYCLYTRKSTESEERQILSIDSQIKEMLEIAKKEGISHPFKIRTFDFLRNPF